MKVARENTLDTPPGYLTKCGKLAAMKIPGTQFPFEFCALRFLFQWRRKEQYLHRHIRAKPTIAQLRSALKYFQVARNSKDLGKDEKATIVLRAFSDIQGRERLGPEDKVTMLAKRFKDDGFQHNLSAASKLLWLKSGSVLAFDFADVNDN